MANFIKEEKLLGERIIAGMLDYLVIFLFSFFYTVRFGTATGDGGT